MISFETFSNEVHGFADPLSSAKVRLGVPQKGHVVLTGLVRAHVQPGYPRSSAKDSTDMTALTNYVDVPVPNEFLAVVHVEGEENRSIPDGQPTDPTQDAFYVVRALPDVSEGGYVYNYLANGNRRDPRDEQLDPRPPIRSTPEGVLLSMPLRTELFVPLSGAVLPPMYNYQPVTSLPGAIPPALTLQHQAA